VGQGLNTATRNILEFGLVGLVLAGGLLGVLQVRPASVLPFEGAILVEIASPGVQFAPSADGCHNDCTATSLNLTIDEVTVHHEGELNLTGSWLRISEAPTTLDVARISGIGQIVGQASIPPGNINLIRLNVSSAYALLQGASAPIQVSIPSGKVDVVLSPTGHIKSGKSTIIFLDFTLSINCGGNGDCRLKPVRVLNVFGPG
jgi:hypothetical protein